MAVQVDLAVNIVGVFGMAAGAQSLHDVARRCRGFSGC